METNNTLTLECIRYSYSNVFEHMLDPQSRVRELSIIRYLANAQILFRLEKRQGRWEILFLAKFAFHCILSDINYELCISISISRAMPATIQFQSGWRGKWTNSNKKIFLPAFLAGKMEFAAKAGLKYLTLHCQPAVILLVFSLYSTHTVFNQYARQSEYFKESHPPLAPSLIQCHFVAFCCLSSRGRGGIGTDSPE